ncbi:MULTISPECIES: UbiD family decarboxylase [unclassified Bradyrhizobium]|uniref:UbiD family decarboxylase n=1 Tax=unclassified Bradyrhizobium TaxID=2631580 RepID=UPI001FF842F8|nr:MULTISPECIES: UbiD family decarboxylase [unclassified Bradyrhizobium]MCK1312397.1 UbiD family decarboxylase [Bradyrhizobium sp. 23]MCK1331802.1 UbiD family decarboxylase [Bradyrhizobium sp. CW9]MCK1505167.1 UbiD family decarboxylase [Bradyrhizobium sp. 18]MCK1629270.1 UbiD family decarboxylase [Bradyrhizobium sp. 162]MCK1695062.1 UbiD family decarboxylase [Bradyrhizobium sp. 144]
MRTEHMVRQEANPPSDLRAWLTHLIGRGRLAIAREGIGLVDELAAVAKRLERDRAVLFPRPGGHEIPIVANLFTGRDWVADAIGVSEDQLLSRFLAAAREPLPTHEVASGLVQEVVHGNVDLLRQLPIPKHNERDSGPYITAGLLIARNPETGVQNVSIHRCQISGPNRIGVLLLPRHTLSYYRIAEKKGEALEIAIVIGAHPVLLLASQAIAALDEDEMAIAGALLGKPVDVVKCRTNSVRVPAHAEIVIEGRILPGVREPEGPFGEFPQYYGPRANREVIEVDAITHRAQPIFHTIVGGGYEHLILGGVPREATLLQHLRRSFPNVLDVRLTRGGTCRYHLAIKIDKTNDGEPKNVMMSAFGAHYDVKQVVVVDKDVDISSTDEIEWAVATRFQADRDLLVVAGALGSKLDPTSNDGISAKMGLDATAPIDAPELAFKRIRVKGEDQVDLAAALQADPNAAFARILAEVRS